MTDPAWGLEQWLSYIDSVHPVGWDLGLERVSTVAHRLGLTHPGAITVLVAGTNGKGSTCEFLEAFARANNLLVGKSTSPHLLRFNERIAIDGQSAPDDTITDAFLQIEEARAEVTLTYFEFATLASLYIFNQRKVDVAILEVGLGGRLDAMNIVDPDLTIITSISIDHTGWLGNTRDEIAREKAGIMRPATDCIVIDRDPPESLFEVADTLGARLRLIGRDFQAEALTTRLPVDSYTAALQAALSFGWDVSSAVEIAANTQLAGRRTLLADKCELLLDVAHNPAAALSLSDYLRSTWSGRAIHAVMGMYKDKDIEAVSALLVPLFKTCHLTGLTEERGESPEMLLRRLSGKPTGNIQTYAKIADALDGARRAAGPDDLILVFGSFPVVSGVMQHLNQNEFAQY